MSTVTRGSRSRFVGHLRPTAVLMAALPSTTSTQTTVLCTDPSSLNVETTAWFGSGRRRGTCGSSIEVMAPPATHRRGTPACPLATGRARRRGKQNLRHGRVKCGAPHVEPPPVKPCTQRARPLTVCKPRGPDRGRAPASWRSTTGEKSDEHRGGGHAGGRRRRGRTDRCDRGDDRRHPGRGGPSARGGGRAGAGGD